MLPTPLCGNWLTCVSTSAAMFRWISLFSRSVNYFLIVMRPPLRPPAGVGFAK